MFIKLIQLKIYLDDLLLFLDDATVSLIGCAVQNSSKWPPLSKIQIRNNFTLLASDEPPALLSHSSNRKVHTLKAQTPHF